MRRAYHTPMSLRAHDEEYPMRGGHREHRGRPVVRPPVSSAARVRATPVQPRLLPARCAGEEQGQEAETARDGGDGCRRGARRASRV